MEVIRVSKRTFMPIALPGMGRSVEVNDISREEIMRIQDLYARQDLAIEFIEEPGVTYPVIKIWVNPHGAQITLFV